MTNPLPFGLCDGCRLRARCRYGVTSEALEPDGSARFELTCSREHQGAEDTAHGGWTASALEEILGRLVYLHGVRSVARSLTVEFLRPVPLDRELIGRSRVVSFDDRRWTLVGELLLASSGVELATATGVSVAIDRDAHRERFERWMHSQGNV